jgi:phospho-N-acetylmuramoyl-pentapeptide-transferase
MLFFVSCLSFFSSVVGVYLVKYFFKTRSKSYNQPIRTDLVIDHSKKVLISFGGIAILLGVTVPLLLLCAFRFLRYHEYPTVEVYSLLFLLAGSFIIGFVDDFLKVTKRNTKGLSGYVRFLMQIAVGLYFLKFLYDSSPNTIEIIRIPIPFIGFFDLNLGVYGMLVKLFIFVGCTNAFNITDGLDGLAGTQFIQFCISLLIFIFFCIFGLGNFLGVRIDIIVFIIFISIFATLGFLLFNSHPASIIMGDCGSMALGAISAGLAIMLNLELCLVFLLFIPMCETLSVMLQVASYKLFKKRIFKISPVHHHFEALGYKETKIVSGFFITSLIVSLLFITTFYL